jgi:hypothetical protein
MTERVATSPADADKWKTIMEASERAKHGECVCDTFLGRECCMHVSHGDLWDAKCIENGRKFFYVIRAKNKAEAEEIGREAAQSNGEECYAVSRHCE